MQNIACAPGGYKTNIATKRGETEQIKYFFVLILKENMIPTE